MIMTRYTAFLPEYKCQVIAETLAYLSAKILLSLTGAEIITFEICLENRTNFEEKNSVFKKSRKYI